MLIRAVVLTFGARLLSALLSMQRTHRPGKAGGDTAILRSSSRLSIATRYRRESRMSAFNRGEPSRHMATALLP